MNADMTLETQDDKRFAPPSHLTPPAQVDNELEVNLEKIPDKMAFKIGEVADLAGVKPYVLRYWETEFDSLRPQKAKNGQRIYDRKNVELVMMIKKLLYRDRFSIEGARSALQRLKKDTRKNSVIRSTVEHMEDVRLKAQDLVHSITELKAFFQT